MLVDGVFILEEDENLQMPENVKVFNIFNCNEKLEKKKFKVEFKTPFRLKKNGKYVSNFEASDFLDSAYRRISILNSLYGNGERLPELKASDRIMIKEKNLFWKDLKYYSSRQKELLKLGGVIGSFVIEGEFTPFEISLLKGAEIFNIGKNVAFGLGRVDVREI
ncbi:MAG: CRISPR system precrRNA processing endoribonuclease RAMP protein Cas6 [Brevinematia bacterium]